MPSDHSYAPRSESTATRPGHNGAENGGSPADEQSPAEHLRRAGSSLSQLAEFVSFYLEAKIDGIKRTIKIAGILAALGVLGLLAGATLVVTAVVLICAAVAEALGRLLGHAWLGSLVTGVLILALIAGAIWIVMSRLTKSWKAKTVQHYEKRRRQQREKFGSDITDSAAGPRDGTD